MIFIAGFDSHGDAALRRNQNVDALKGLGVRFEEAKTIFLLVLVHEMDSANPRRDFDLS